jgi:single-strand DNA-binding protein
MSYQKLVLIGRLGQDPEMRYSKDGKAYTKFSVAVNGYKRDDPPTWFRCTAFDKKAEIANEYLHKGGLVYVEGRVLLNEFVGKDGIPRASLDVTIDNIVLIDKGASGNRTNDNSNGYNSSPPYMAAARNAVGVIDDSNDDDEIPF